MGWTGSATSAHEPIPASSWPELNRKSDMADIFQDTMLAGVRGRRVWSESTGSEHEVLVSLPPTYEQGDRNYPLLIVLDANYCFGGAVETARMQAATGEVEDLILVGLGTPGGLAAHGTRRLRDYTPGFAMAGGLEASEIGRMLKGRLDRAGLTVEQAFGGSRLFARFIADELLPSLSAEFRIDQRDIGLAGHSCGGAFAIDLLLNGGHPISKLLVGTFGLDWYSPEALEELERGFAPRAQGPGVFMAIGGGEFADEEMGGAVWKSVTFLDRLRQSAPDLDISIQVFDGETHPSVMPMLIASGVRRFWATGLTYTRAAAGRRLRDTWRPILGRSGFIPTGADGLRGEQRKVPNTPLFLRIANAAREVCLPQSLTPIQSPDQLHIQRLSDPTKHFDRHIASAPFDLAEIARRNANAMGDLLLGQAALQSPLPDVLSDDRLPAHDRKGLLDGTRSQSL